MELDQPKDSPKEEESNTVNDEDNDGAGESSPPFQLSQETKYVRSTPFLTGKPPKDRPTPVFQLPPPPKRITDKFFNPDDICCLALICSQHRRLALFHIETKGFFLPYAACKRGNHALANIIKDLMRKFIDVQQIDIRSSQWTTDRIQIPKNKSFIHRFINRVEAVRSFENSVKKSSARTQHCICHLTRKNTIQWLNYNDICHKIHGLWGPEPKYILEQVIKPVETIPSSSMYFSTWTEVTLEDHETNADILKCGNVSDTETTSLYNEYVLQCFPSRYMTFCSFRIFLHKLGINLKENKALHYFKSFDTEKLSFLRFSDLLLGLIVYSGQFETCWHESCIVKKFEFLFRYYANRQNRMGVDELCKMVVDYHGRPGQPFNESERRSSLVPIRERLVTSSELPREINFCDYSEMLANGKLFQILDLQTTVADFFDTTLKLSPDTSAFLLPTLRWCNQRLTSLQAITLDNLFDSRCEACRHVKYYHSTHFISLSEIGEVLEVRRLDESNHTIGKIHKQFRQDIHESDIHVMANEIINKINKLGLLLFCTDDMSNNKELQTMAESWFFPCKEEAINHMKTIANKVEDILACEPRVLDISTPCYVLGDIHGNLKDLLTYSQVLWKLSPFINQNKYLFLGDYVDRGSYGVECIMYLFCMKILAPQNFFLLRGNHEIREIQEQFSFFKECNVRFNSDLWEAINMALERLPIAAIIDEKIFCSHGGIPTSVETINQIRNVPNPLDNLHASPETWELLWNDPVSNSDFAKIVELEKKPNPIHKAGFARNVKRGTAFLYAELATQKFFRKNNIQFIIRGHEVFEKGYHLYHRGNVITIFSSSKYCDLRNQAAVINIDRRKIRIVVIKEDE